LKASAHLAERSRLRLQQTAPPQVEVTQPHHHQRVTDFASGHQVHGLIHRAQPRGDVLPVIELDRMHELAILDEDRVAGVAHDGGVWADRAQQARVATFITCFFAQLANRGHHGIRFVLVHHTARNFQFHRLRTVAELFHQDELLVRRDGNHVHPVHAIEDIEIVLAAGAG